MANDERAPLSPAIEVEQSKAPAPKSEKTFPDASVVTEMTASRSTAIITDMEDVDAKIKAYLAEALPASEKRISTPMYPKCKVCVVVPAYGERGYILRPISSLAQQKDVTSDEYELIIVVNNPPKMPVQTINETSDDYERKLAHYRVAVDENQSVIQLIRKINGESTDVQTTSEEDHMIADIQASGLRLHVIDKSSIGETLPMAEANVGSARNRGVAEAVARFHEIGRDGIIGQSDGDTSFDERYIRSLIDAFEKDPSLVGLAGKMEFEIDTNDNSDLMKLVTSTDQLKYTYDELIRSLLIKEGEEQNNKTTDSNVEFSGANMASRAYVAALAGGVPKLAGGEDPAFGKAISAFGKITRDETVITRPANRFSPRTDVNAGHGQKLIKQAIRLSQGQSILLKPYKRSKAEKNILHSLGVAIATRSIDPDNLKKIMSVEGVPLLEDVEVSQFSEILEQIHDLTQLQTFSLPGLNELKNKALHKLDQILPDIPLEEAFASLERVFLDNPELATKYEHLREDIFLDVNRFKFISSLFEKSMIDNIPPTKEAFLARLQEIDPSTYDSLSTGPTTWESSIFIQDIYNSISRSSPVQEASNKLKEDFEHFYLLAKNPSGEQILRLWIMRSVWSG